MTETIAVLPRTIPEPKMRRLPTSAAQRATFGVIAKLAPDLLYRAYFKPSRYAGSTEERVILADAIATKERIAGHSVMRYVWESDLPWESRPERTVLLVHGWSGAAAQMTAFVRPLLAAGYRVEAFDAPGHGHAPGNRTNLFEISQIVNALSADAIIAHSLGATSILVALQNGLAAQKLVLISAGAVVDHYPVRFAEAVGAGEEVGLRFKQRLMDEFGPSILRPIEHPAMLQVKAESLVVHDLDDTEAPYTQGLTVAKTLPRSQLVSTAGLGHRRLLREAPVIEEVMRFLR